MANVRPLTIPPDDGREPFLAAIRADPADDAPRLIYADWLEERGEDLRANLIRMQIAAAQDERFGVVDEVIHQRMRKLEAKVKKIIFKGMPARWKKTAHFERGFIGHLEATPKDFLRAGGALLAREVVGLLDVYAAQNDAIAELLKSKSLLHLQSLAIHHGQLENEGAFLVAQAKNLANLRELNLTANYIRTEGIERLAASPHLSNLRSLILKYNDAYERGAKALAESPALQHLETLDIGCNEIGPTGLQHLVHAPFARRLTTLKVQGNPGYEPLLRDASMEVFAKAKHLTNLVELDLQANEIGEAGLTAFADAKGFKSLRKLDLSRNQANAAALEKLVEARFFAPLQWLNLQGNPLGDAGADVLGRTSRASLQYLDLSNCELGPQGMIGLCRGQLLAKVEDLRLDYNTLNDLGISTLASTPHMPNLRTLNLASTRFRCAGAKALAHAHWPNLRELIINYNQPTSTGIIALTKAPWFNNLHRLSMSNANFSTKAAHALVAQALPNLVYMWCGGNIPDEGKQLLRDRFGERVYVH